MKKTLAILFTCIYLFGGTDASQFLKLPHLIAHYVEHKKENPATTLVSFFKIHYVDPQPYDADYAKDMQLPFKTIPNAFFRNTPSLLTQIVVVKPELTLTNQRTVAVFTEDFLSSLLHNKIFQPPRV